LTPQENCREYKKRLNLTSSDFFSEKAKPAVKWGRKATDLLLGDGRVAFENELSIPQLPINRCRFTAFFS
jgi:hypothetical protein